MKRHPIVQFKEYFNELSPNNISKLDEFYANDILFTDPIHSIKGIESVKKYFDKLNKNLISGSFHFTEEEITNNKAYLAWEMTLILKKPSKKVKASGISFLTFDEKITHHRDYFDAGELFYENIPILGTIIRFIKRQIIK